MPRFLVMDPNSSCGVQYKYCISTASISNQVKPGEWRLSLLAERMEPESDEAVNLFFDKSSLFCMCIENISFISVYSDSSYHSLFNSKLRNHLGAVNAEILVFLP